VEPLDLTLVSPSIGEALVDAHGALKT
jgi:hypothetical protein